jgi:chromosome segregation ATPase
VPAQAQQNRDQELIRRLRQQLLQLQQEQSAQQQAAQSAQAEKVELQKERDALKAELGRARSAASAQTARAGEAEQQAGALRGEREQLRTRVLELEADLERRGQSIQALRGELATARRTIGLREEALAGLQARHKVQAEGLQICIVNNDALHKLGLELLDRYAGKGVAEVLAVNEPFLQFKRVELENLVQGYRDKIDQQAVKGASAAMPGSGRAP